MHSTQRRRAWVACDHKIASQCSTDSPVCCACQRSLSPSTIVTVCRHCRSYNPPLASTTRASRLPRPPVSDTPIETPNSPSEGGFIPVTRRAFNRRPHVRHEPTYQLSTAERLEIIERVFGRSFVSIEAYLQWLYEGDDDDGDDFGFEPDDDGDDGWGSSVEDPLPPTPVPNINDVSEYPPLGGGLRAITSGSRGVSATPNTSHPFSIRVAGNRPVTAARSRNQAQEQVNSNYARNLSPTTTVATQQDSRVPSNHQVLPGNRSPHTLVQKPLNTGSQPSTQTSGPLLPIPAKAATAAPKIVVASTNPSPQRPQPPPLDIGKAAEDASVMLELFGKLYTANPGTIDRSHENIFYEAFNHLLCIQKEFRLSAAKLNETIEQLPLELEDTKVDAGCIICYSDVADTVVMPCGHLALCTSCCDGIGVKVASAPGRKTVKCPICRTVIQDRIKIFRSQRS